MMFTEDLKKLVIEVKTLTENLGGKAGRFSFKN